jgi:uncharacterized integral membrane protein
MTETKPADPPVAKSQRPRTAAERRDRSRMVAAALIGALVAIFALLNLGDVKVRWLFWTFETPLIVVVLITFVLGMLVDRLMVVRARKKRKSAS